MALKGRTALITGSGRNIGEAIAKALARQGVNVVVNVRASVGDGERVTEEIRAMGVEAILVVADVTDSAQVRAMGARVRDRFGKVDILINNVGIAPMSRLQDTTDEFWDRVIRTSLTSAFYCIREFVGPMVEQRWGRIINIGGQAGIKGTKFKSANAAAKHGVIGLTHSVSNEFAEFGITCNHIGPGHLERAHEVKYYEDHIQELDPEYRQSQFKKIPVGRFGTAEEVAATAAFLASEEAAYITGQTILLNGGMYFV